ncbi:nucleotidyltransferase domain-containing protein [Candidatus Gracilibacteria bacterium]|nr:nucleotidyltransferase domain-containing protein [Candidatus Gracilibacteria bacterium]
MKIMSHLPNEIQNIVNTYIPKNGEYEVFLFGSRVKGDYNKYSDYDIGIRGKKPFPRTDFLKIQSELRELPYLIDLVDFYGTDIPFQTIATQYTQPWNNKE